MLFTQTIWGLNEYINTPNKPRTNWIRSYDIPTLCLEVLIKGLNTWNILLHNNIKWFKKGRNVPEGNAKSRIVNKQTHHRKKQTIQFKVNQSLWWYRVLREITEILFKVWHPSCRSSDNKPCNKAVGYIRDRGAGW